MPLAVTEYVPLLRELVSRDLKLKYRRSMLGYAWSLLNPLMMMVILTYVFSFMFRFNISNYSLYLICGQVLWTCFSESTTRAMYSVLSNSILLRKVYLPKLIFPISVTVSSFVTMGFSLAAVLIVMIFTKATFYWTLFLVWMPLLLLFIFCCGVGILLAALSVRFRDVQHLYSVITLAWMYGTPIFYPIDAVPTEVQSVIYFNPMFHYMSLFRELVLYGRVPSWEEWGICGLMSLCVLVGGTVIFRKMQSDFILYF